MHGPNKTVARARSAKLVKVYESTKQLRSRAEAEMHAGETRNLYPSPRYTVRMTSYWLGPQYTGHRYWKVRAYEDHVIAKARGFRQALDK